MERLRGGAAGLVRTGALAGAVLVGLFGAGGDLAERSPTAQRATGGAGTAALAAASSSYLTLTAGSLDAVGLTYVGVVTVSGASGDVQILRFTLTSGTLTDMTVTQACAGGVAVGTSAGSVTLGSTTFDAVSLAVTVAGTAVTYTPASPPTTAFPSEVVLQSLTLSATTVSADSLSAPSLTVQPLGC